MNKGRIYLGAFFILIGVLFLLENLGLNVNFGYYWPVVLLVPGIIFWVTFFQNKETRSSAILIPGTILVIYSLYFFFNQLNDYKYAGETSFIFTLGIALGFFAAYYYAKDQVKKKGYLIPAWILTGVALINLLGTTTQWEWWPILLIGLGVYLLYKNDKVKSNDNEQVENNDKNN